MSRQFPMNDITAVLAPKRGQEVWWSNAYTPKCLEGAIPLFSFSLSPPMKQHFLQAPICIRGWQWVFPAILLGTWFFSLHKSKNTIKVMHQRAINGTNKSTLLQGVGHWTKSFSAAFSSCDHTDRLVSPVTPVNPQKWSITSREGSGLFCGEEDLQIKYFLCH